MPPEPLAERVARVLPGATLSDAFGGTTADVPPDGWVAALTAARDGLGARTFDWLSAVDRSGDPGGAGFDGFDVVACLWVRGPGSAEPLLLRTRLPAGDPHLATATGVFRGAAWHERETHEMFGIGFDGHEGLRPLLLPDGFEGHPLRKDFVLAARVAKPWPGAKEPGESAADEGAARKPGRRRMLPPGVPDPGTWGPG